MEACLHGRQWIPETWRFRQRKQRCWVWWWEAVLGSSPLSSPHFWACLSPRIYWGTEWRQLFLLEFLKGMSPRIRKGFISITTCISKLFWLHHKSRCSCCPGLFFFSGKYQIWCMNKIKCTGHCETKTGRGIVLLGPYPKVTVEQLK